MGKEEGFKMADRREHPFCRCYSSDAQYYPSWRDVGKWAAISNGIKDGKKNDQLAPLKATVAAG